MHRIPLQLPKPSISWDRKTPEHKLFENTLNKPNVEETDTFLTILDQETEDYFKLACNKVADQFNDIPQLLNSKDRQTIQKGMRLLNEVILRAPRDSPVLPTALKLRDPPQKEVFPKNVIIMLPTDWIPPANWMPPADWIPPSNWVPPNNWPVNRIEIN